MGKKSNSSWFSVVKRAFSSPTKEENNKSCRRKEEHHHEHEEDAKKREKRSWLFRKLNSNSNNNNSNHVQVCETKTTTDNGSGDPISDVAQQIATAAATTAQAAVEIVRLTRPASFVRGHRAAILIQTAFRGYLARRALRALKGLVKLQAVVRGQNVRKQTKLTLKCMQALVRVQDRVRDQRARLSHEGSRRSMFDESNHSGILDSTYLQQNIHERRSLSRDLSSILNDWDNRRYATEEIEAMVECKKEAALKREKALAYAFSSQIWRSRRSPSIGDEKEMEEGPKWLDRWMTNKQWESNSNCRASTDRKEAIKTVEIDTSRPYSCTPRRSQSQIHQPRQNIPTPHCYNLLTPSPSCKTKPLQVRSASPRCLKEEKSYSVAHTPSLGSRYRYAVCATRSNAIPNYMAATESAKARVRSQSAPKQKPSTPEREQCGGGSSAKKRLSYPAPEPQYYSSFSQNLRSPSFKSVQAAHLGMERKSNYSSNYSESIIGGGEISPCSTTDLRWLK